MSGQQNSINKFEYIASRMGLYASVIKSLFMDISNG